MRYEENLAIILERVNRTMYPWITSSQSQTKSGADYKAFWRVTLISLENFCDRPVARLAMALLRDD